MAVNRTSTRVRASTFSPGGAKWKSMLTKSCGWYDLIVPQRYSVPFGPISTIWPPGFASTRIALAGAPPMADTLNLPSGHQLSIAFRNTSNALAWLQGTSMVLTIGSSITFSFSVSLRVGIHATASHSMPKRAPHHELAADPRYLPPCTGGPHYYGIPVARVTPDAFTETMAVLRCGDHRRPHVTVCRAGSGADSVSGLPGASSRPSRAGRPWRADLPQQLQLLPWLGCQGGRDRPQPRPGRSGAPRSER